MMNDADRIPWTPLPAHDANLPHWRNALTPGCRACERGDDPIDSTVGARRTEWAPLESRAWATGALHQHVGPRGTVSCDLVHAERPTDLVPRPG